MLVFLSSKDLTSVNDTFKDSSGEIILLLGEMNYLIMCHFFHHKRIIYIYISRKNNISNLNVLIDSDLLSKTDK